MSSKRLFGLFSIITLTALSTYFILHLLRERPESKEVISKSQPFNVMEINFNKETHISPLFGLVTYDKTQAVQLKVNGTIDPTNRSLKTGEKVKKDELLIKVERIGILYEILEKRSALKKTILDFIPLIEKESPSETVKWQKYAQQIQRTSFIPTLPEINLQTEEKVLDETDLLESYYNLKKLEREAESYFYIAPFDGVIIDSKVSPGSKINKDITLLELAKTGSLVIKTSLPIENAFLLSRTEEYFFLNSGGDTIGSGVFKSNESTLSDSSRIISTFNTQSVSPSLLGETVEIVASTRPLPTRTTIPKSAVKNGHVQLYVDDQVLALPIQVISEKQDSVVIEGIQERCYIITNPK